MAYYQFFAIISRTVDCSKLGMVLIDCKLNSICFRNFSTNFTKLPKCNFSVITEQLSKISKFDIFFTSTRYLTYKNLKYFIENNVFRCKIKFGIKWDHPQVPRTNRSWDNFKKPTICQKYFLLILIFLLTLQFAHEDLKIHSS